MGHFTDNMFRSVENVEFYLSYLGLTEALALVSAGSVVGVVSVLSLDGDEIL